MLYCRFLCSGILPEQIPYSAPKPVQFLQRYNLGHAALFPALLFNLLSWGLTS